MVEQSIQHAPSKKELDRFERALRRHCSPRELACWEQLRQQWQLPTPTLDEKLVRQLAQQLESIPRLCCQLAELIADFYPESCSLASEVFLHALVALQTTKTAQIDPQLLLRLGQKTGLHHTDPDLMGEVLRAVVRHPDFQPCAEAESLLPLLSPSPEVAVAWWIVNRQKCEQCWKENEPPTELLFGLLAARNEKLLPPSRLRTLEQWLRAFWKQRGPLPLEQISSPEHAACVLEASSSLPLEGPWLLELICRFDLWAQAFQLLENGLPPEAPLHHPHVLQHMLDRWYCNAWELKNALSGWAALAPWEKLHQCIQRCVFQEYPSPECREEVILAMFTQLLQHPQRSFTSRELQEIPPSQSPPQRPWLLVIAPPKKLARLLLQKQGEPLFVSQLQELLPWLRMGPTGEQYLVLYCPSQPEKLPDRHPFYHWLPKRKRFAIVALPPKLAPTLLQLENEPGASTQ